MLTPQERQTLKSLLSARFNTDQLEELVTATAQDWDSTVSQNANKLDAIKDILDAADTSGWILELLNAMSADFSERLAEPFRGTEIGRVRQIEQQVQQRLGRGTALVDLFKSCFVGADLPYVNRPKVSDAFADLEKAGGLRLVVINGPPGSGKTYSKELPQWVSEMQQAAGKAEFKVFFEPLDEGDYDAAPTALVRHILLEWGRHDVQIPADYAARNSDLSRWLLSYLPAGETWWLVIDGLRQVSQNRDLLGFLMELANSVANTTRGARLVLLDLDEQTALPAGAARKARSIRLERLTADDLVEYFFRPMHAAAAGGQPLDLTAVGARAQGVLHTVESDEDAETRLLRLKDHLLRAARELGLC